MRHGMAGRAVGIAVCLAVSVGSGHAAEKIRLDDLHRRYVGGVENRRANVITRDGPKYHTRRLLIRDDGVWVDGSNYKLQALARQDIRKIEIGRGRHYSHHIVEHAELASFFAGGGEAAAGPVWVLGFVLSTPIWAYTAASAPFFLAADGVAFFIPPKAFEIVP